MSLSSYILKWVQPCHPHSRSKGVLQKQKIHQHKPPKKTEFLEEEEEEASSNLLKACSAENLLEESLEIIFLKRSLAAGDTVRKILEGNLRLALTTASKISAAESP